MRVAVGVAVLSQSCLQPAGESLLARDSEASVQSLEAQCPRLWRPSKALSLFSKGCTTEDPLSVGLLPPWTGASHRHLSLKLTGGGASAFLRAPPTPILPAWLPARPTPGPPALCRVYRGAPPAEGTGSPPHGCQLQRSECRRKRCDGRRRRRNKQMLLVGGGLPRVTLLDSVRPSYRSSVRHSFEFVVATTRLQPRAPGVRMHVRRHARKNLGRHTR